MVLVEHGADIHRVDNDGNTPLSLAENTELKQSMMGKLHSLYVSWISYYSDCAVLYLRKLEERDRSTADNESTTPTHKERR